MNKSLFGTMLKNKTKTITSFSFGSILYLSLVIWIYPSLADSKGLELMLEAFPEDFLSAFGFSGGIENLSGFVAGEYYGLLLIIILLIYCVSTATQLIARLVDRGSMAYLLSSGLSRTKVAMTQIAVMVLGLFLIVGITLISGVVGADIFIETNDFDVANFVKLNVVTFLFFFMVSGYCFFFSCLLNDEKKVLGISGGISVAFFAIDMVAGISDKLDWMQYITIFTAYKPTEIAQGSVNILPVSVGLGIAGITLFTAAVIIFKKRDLPL
ncbi:ABC transporter permease subunit [Virgibacillus doumboii]|uniref:ABC transporter permease subunit n=1 Tax=Virgibacillus doumboii TaxID=2697503 RepID=UPI0013E00DB6|nr:ABC transporter permease subunit [Virgibacillus doumboii]